MCLIGAITWTRGALIAFSQVVGAIASGRTVSSAHRTLYVSTNHSKGQYADTRSSSPGRLAASAMLTLYRSIAAVVAILFPGPLVVRTSLGGGTSVVQGLFIETFLTAQLVFTIFMLAAEKHKGTFLAPIGIGLSLFIAELTGLSLYFLDVAMAKQCAS